MDSRQYADMLADAFPNNHIISKLKKINSFNVGAFSNGLSKYTNPGQLMKGGALDYKLGGLDMEVSGGRMDQVDFNGNKEKFITGSLGLKTNGLKNQKVGLLYYFTNPIGKEMQLSGRKKNTHIYTLLYELNYEKLNIQLDYSTNPEQATGATSAESSLRKTNLWEQSNFNIGLDWTFYQDRFLLSGGVERLGQSFNNTSLYYNIKGMVNYNMKLTSFWFDNALKVDVEYHVLESTTSKSVNNKYGFAIQTNSRRIPKLTLAYKPFTTFSTTVDTLNNLSFTMVGSVYLAKLDYMYKRKNNIYLFSFNYTENSSSMDTVKYSSRVWNFMFNATISRMNINVNLGQNVINSNVVNDYQLAMNNNLFSSINVSNQFGKALGISLGGNIGLHKGEFTKYGWRIQVNSMLPKIPLQYFVSFMHSKYLIDNTWERIYAGSLGVSIPLNFKLY